MTQAEFEQEIRKAIVARLDAGETVSATWLTQEIVSTHSPERLFSSDVIATHQESFDWQRICSYGHTRSTVGKIVREYRPTSSGDTTAPLLPGFERLQRGYSVEREGDQQVVPIEQMTDAELAAKADELRRMSEGCLQHADELLRYLDQRLSLIATSSTSQR